jgi:hypothetical protein
VNRVDSAHQIDERTSSVRGRTRDGASETREVETRSALLHDLAHYAVEIEAGLTSAFYGLLARGIAYDALTSVPQANLEARQTEVVVVLLQGIFKSDDLAKTDPDRLAQNIVAGFRSTGAEPPTWVSPDFIIRVRERLRRGHGQWRATPFHQTMELEFPELVSASSR